MTISREVWIILACSVVLGLTIMIITFFVTKHKTNKFKSDYLKNVTQLVGKDNKALERKNHGELLWDLKSKYQNPLEDILLEILINTIIRNKYKTFMIKNRDIDYEKISLAKLAKVKYQDKVADFNLLFIQDNLNDDFDKIYQNLKAKQMIAIAEAKRKSKQVKKLINYFKMSQIKYDYLYLGKGLLLIVK